MEMRQKVELKKMLLPGLQQSLKILPLSLLDLKTLLDNEMLNNPFLEETEPKNTLSKPATSSLSYRNRFVGKDSGFVVDQITRSMSLQEMLLRELGVCAKNNIELMIGQEIIGNIDANGYLTIGLEKIADCLAVPVSQAESVLKLIQGFEPAGVGARTVAECLLIQLESVNEKDPLLRKIVEFHLEDIAKKNYSRIAKALKEPQEKITPLIQKILKFNPKPGRNYSTDKAQRIIPDIIISDNDDELEITINNEDIPNLNINQDYKDMLKDNNLDARTKEFLTDKLRNALDLLRAISKRQTTLRRVIEIITEVQQGAIREGLSYLKPLTLNEVAQRLNMHESTICRAIMNKYVKLPYGTVALKELFPSHIQGQNGQCISSTHVKKLIKELIDQEDKSRPLSDQKICAILLKERNLKLVRRTVAKYREELKILSSVFRKER